MSRKFVEQSNTAMKNEPLLPRGGVDPDYMRELVRYATAYGPVVDAFDAAAREMRESVDSAMAKAGMDSLTTYSVAARLSRRPEGAHLGTLVRNMRRTLGRTRRSKKRAEAPAPDPTTLPLPPRTELCPPLLTASAFPGGAFRGVDGSRGSELLFFGDTPRASA